MNTSEALILDRLHAWTHSGITITPESWPRTASATIRSKHWCGSYIRFYFMIILEDGTKVNCFSTKEANTIERAIKNANKDIIKKIGLPCLEMSSSIISYVELCTLINARMGDAVQIIYSLRGSENKRPIRKI